MHIVVPVSGRSDEGLSKPVIDRLENADWCEVTTLELIPGSYEENLSCADRYLQSAKDVDMFLIFCDRIEMLAVAHAAFHHNVKIGHVYAGDGNNIATHDDINRHVISLYADLCFCSTRKAEDRVRKLLRAAGKQPIVQVVGSTHMDDLQVDYSLVSKHPSPYDLVLYNPPTRTDMDTRKSPLEQLRSDLSFIIDIIRKGAARTTVWIGPNADPNHSIIKHYVNNLSDDRIVYYDNLPRPQFRGLLERCYRFISNSSCIVYEAPYFLEELRLVHVGTRNLERDKITNFEPGASDKIVDILRWYFGC
jgi:UDP-N-acetylglucosamine 2-epimerase